MLAVHDEEAVDSVGPDGRLFHQLLRLLAAVPPLPPPRPPLPPVPCGGLDTKLGLLMLLLPLGRMV